MKKSDEIHVLYPQLSAHEYDDTSRYSEIAGLKLALSEAIAEIAEYKAVVAEFTNAVARNESAIALARKELRDEFSKMLADMEGL